MDTRYALVRLDDAEIEIALTRLALDLRALTPGTYLSKCTAASVLISSVTVQTSDLDERSN
jgi:hypothetical protein